MLILALVSVFKPCGRDVQWELDNGHYADDDEHLYSKRDIVSNVVEGRRQSGRETTVGMAVFLYCSVDWLFGCKGVFGKARSKYAEGVSSVHALLKYSEIFCTISIL